MEKETSFEEFCQALEGREADITAHTEHNGAVGLEMNGPLPLLFNVACEIVKQLALQEENNAPGLGKRYVTVLCQTVSKEMDEELAGAADNRMRDEVGYDDKERGCQDIAGHH